MGEVAKPEIEGALDGVGLVLVEYHSGGRVAELAHEWVGRGGVVSVTDNSGTYRGPGLRTDAGVNLGFGTGCNRAVEALPDGIDVVVLQNPDARIAASGLVALVDLVRSGPWDAVVPTIVGAKRRPIGFRYPSAWREPALAAFDTYRLRRPLPPQSPGRGNARQPPGCGQIDVVHAAGRFGTAALLVVRRHAFEEIGGFDERFFLYGEDLDLWHRLDRAGFAVGFASGVEATHEEGHGSRASVLSRTTLRWLPRELFAEIHRPRGYRPYRAVHRVFARLLPSGPATTALRKVLATGVPPGPGIEALRRILL